MENDLLKVAIRKNALFIPAKWVVRENPTPLNETTSVLLANANRLGFTFSEDLLAKLNYISPQSKLKVLELLKEITGVKKNWTPLVKQWNIPTGESYVDHLFTWLANILRIENGTKLPCGHTIPDNTFPLERYNGCPFCGTPFEFAALEYEPTSNPLKVLELWTQEDLRKHFARLLESPVALDATQIDDLKILLSHYKIPEDVSIKMKETLMVVINTLVKLERTEEAGRLFTTPNDLLRYLWYRKTGYLQIVEPKTIIKRMKKNARNWHRYMDESASAQVLAEADLKLKYSRKECRRYATWLNNLSMRIADQCENMHAKRSIWVRFIRALRLAEYSKKAGFENLAELLDRFYNEDYEVWQGKVNARKWKFDDEGTFELLKQRPGLFARSLFASMLWFGPEVTILHFKEVIDKVPARLIFTLNMYAEFYFNKDGSRTVKPLGGVNKRIPMNKMLQLYGDQDLLVMQQMIQDLSLEVIKNNLRKVENTNQTIYIDERLFNIPIAIGDRNEQLQDLPGALMGTRFKLEGDAVRLFMQWGEGLPAQHLDMDLSCTVASEKGVYYCSYAQLVAVGCKHSGDIQRIPNKVGTAEYIDLNLGELEKAKAKYVSFTCNAYTNGSIAPNLIIGWMNSRYLMKISSSGVAYNPTAVQHQVRIRESLTKGMVFGVLDVAKREIIWLEMAFGGQVVQNLDTKGVEALIHKLDAKLKIGDLLCLKADVQELKVIEDAEKADEVYDLNWALNTAEVSQLFL